MILPHKILVVDHYSGLGGAELSLLDLVKNIDKQDLEISAVLPGRGDLSNELRAHVKNIYYLPLESWRWWSKGKVNVLRFLVSIPRQLKSLFAWIVFLRKEKPAAIHFNLNRFVEPLIAAWLCGIPSIVHFRNIPSVQEFVNGEKFFGGYKTLNAINSLAKFWIANSQATFDDIQGKHKRKHGKVFLIYNGIDVDLYSSEPAVKDETEPFIVAKIAGLVPWKNHNLYIDVAQETLKRFSNVEFWIVGKGESTYVESLEEKIKALHLQDKVIVKGFQRDIPGLLRRIDVVVHTTNRESFGRVYAEAMAAGKPVVALKGGAANELIIDSRTGFLIEEPDPALFAEKIEYLKTDAQARLIIGRQGRLLIQEKFSVNAYCRGVRNLYTIVTKS